MRGRDCLGAVLRRSGRRLRAELGRGPRLRQKELFGLERGDLRTLSGEQWAELEFDQLLNTNTDGASFKSVGGEEGAIFNALHGMRCDI